MHLYWTNKHKYYKLFEQETLFGTTDVVCVWGRIGGKLGNYKVIPCQDPEEVQKTIDSIKKKRLKRGYELTEPKAPVEINNSFKKQSFIHRDTLIKCLKNSDENISLDDLLLWLSRYTSKNIIYS